MYVIHRMVLGTSRVISVYVPEVLLYQVDVQKHGASREIAFMNVL